MTLAALAPIQCGGFGRLMAAVGDLLAPWQMWWLHLGICRVLLDLQWPHPDP